MCAKEMSRDELCKIEGKKWKKLVEWSSALRTRYQTVDIKYLNEEAYLNIAVREQRYDNLREIFNENEYREMAFTDYNGLLKELGV